MARSIGKRSIKPRSPIAAPPLFEQEIDTSTANGKGLNNGVDSALTNTRRGMRQRRLMEHDHQRVAERAKERELGQEILQTDPGGPQRAHDIISAKAVAEHRRLTGGGSVI